MPSIKTWLADLGLEKYLTAFEQAEIDFPTLPELSDADLRELGLPLGPRRKIARALRDHGADSALPANTTISDPPDAERRHLTIMFVDLVGSTQMSMRLDVEDMRMVISQYQNTVAEVVGGFEGFVATLMGDGVLCYFGWPHAREDDTERAVRAGLAVIEACQKITTPDGTALASRVGVASGVVIVGDLVGRGARHEPVVVGEAPNLAARLQSLAKPNQLVIPGEARAMLSDAFSLVSLGVNKLKGIDRPVEAFRVDSEHDVESRFAARHGNKMLPLVNRTSEMDEIAQRWQDARGGEGHLLVLAGEPGIGKSRVVRAAIDSVAPENHVRLIYQCSPYHSDSAFYPFIQQIRLSAGLTPQDSNEVRLNKLEAAIEGTPEMHAQMAKLLGIDGTERYGLQDVPAARQRDLLLQTIVDYLLAKAREKPVLMVLEDIHWIDPTSLELIMQLVEHLSGARILVLATTRLPFDPLLTPHSNLSWLVLERLDRDGTVEITERLAAGKALPPEIRDIIAARTDGVPLFVEELTRSILESGALKDSGAEYELAGALGDIAIPETLHDSLTARLDRLGPVREVAQIAACVGREFDHRLMPQICDIPQAKLDEALATLSKTDLIRRRGTPPLARYQFKHALIRDVAYESLLKERRRTVHRRILSSLENEPGTAPELLAAHAEAAGLTDRSIELWGRAGTQAVARPAYQEAAAHFQRAVKLNEPFVAAGDVHATQRAVSLLVQLSHALAPAKGHWSDDVMTTLEEAATLANRVEETQLRGDIIYGLLMGTYFRGELEASVARAEELKGVALRAQDRAQLLVAKRLAGIGRLTMGRFDEAETHLEEAAALCDEVADQDLAARFGHDPVTGTLVYQALNATFRGETARGLDFLEQTLKRAEDVGHVSTRCGALGLAVVVSQISGDRAAEVQYLNVLSKLTREHDVSASRMGADAGNGLDRLAKGDAGGLDAYLVAEKEIIDANIRLLVPGHRAVAAYRLFDLGLTEQAREMAEASERLMEKTGERSWLPEVWRLQAWIAEREGDNTLAETILRRAVALAEKTGGALWHLRACTDLVQLLTGTDAEGEAKSLLQASMSGIRDGDCRAEMQRASELLQE